MGRKKITIVDLAGISNYFSDGRCETSNKHYLTNYPPVAIANINSAYDVNYITNPENMKNIPSGEVYIQTTVSTFEKDLNLAKNIFSGKKLIFFGNNINLVKAKSRGHKLIGDIEKHLLKGMSFESITPNWSFLKKEYKIPFAGKKFLVVETSRGCVFRCTFCTEAGKKITNKPIDRIINEVKNARSLGAKAIIFKSACFTENKAKTIEICREIIRSKLNEDIVFLCNSRISSIDEEIISWLKKANFFMVAFGIETTSKESQRRINKIIDMEYAEKVFSLLNKQGILIWAHFIVFPWETEKDQLDKIRFAKKNEVDFIQVLPLHILPGTPLWSRREGAKSANSIKMTENKIRKLYLSFYLLNFNVKRFFKIARLLKLYRMHNLLMISRLMFKKDTFV